MPGRTCKTCWSSSPCAGNLRRWPIQANITVVVQEAGRYSEINKFLSRDAVHQNIRAFIVSVCINYASAL